MKRSQIALAIGLQIGDFMIFSPSPAMEASRLFAKMLSRSWMR